MNKYKQAHIFCKAKARCFFIIMCFHLVLGQVPGPCRHSVTKEHLLNLDRLIDNQLQNGCSMTYKFMERHGLSKVCYVKAAFPQILELLDSHFRYTKDSDNYGYVDKLKNLVWNIYSEQCIPQINEEIEVSALFTVDSSSLREALGKIKEVIQLYMELMTKNDKPVDWNCEEEYAEDYPESTTALAQTTGATECHCSCPTLGYGASEQVSLPANGKTKPMETSQWEDLVQPSQLQSHSSQPPKLAQPPMDTRNPWDYIPVTHDYNSHHRPKETESITSVSKEEKEEANGDILFLAFPGAGNLRSTTGSSASLDEKNGCPGCPGASCHRVHLDPVTGTPDTSESSDASQSTPVSAESVRGMDASVSHVVSEKRSPTTVASSAFTQSPTQNRVSGSTGSRSSQRTSFLDSSRAVSPSSQEHADNPVTPVPSHEAPVRSTPTKPEDTTAVLLTKRSLGPRVSPEDRFLELNDRSDVSQAGETTRSTIKHTVPLPGRTTVSGLPVRQFDPPVPPPVPKHESVSMRTTREKLESPGVGPQGLAETADSDSPSGQPERGAGAGFQNGAEGEGHFSYKIAFIAASACGGLMLLITLYCFRKQKKLKALLHSSEGEGNQRLTSFDKDIEMQDCERTELSCLDSS
ncbi:macrophage colony-stimulating factor 1a isoform X2 [Anguilla rostrata]|uniref:macrophage colony-stimulating factor 1a isoform X2 n=1 Tax=Anguilla rostrata TaxID=7938 RepID=UPI0030D0606B